MAYVDLNPVRAKIVEKLEQSDHTSIKKRLDEMKPNQLEEKLAIITGSVQSQKLDLKLKDYIQLVEWTGENIIHPGKAPLPKQMANILERLNLQSNHWLKHVENYQKNHCHVAGSLENIRKKAQLIGKRCLKGISAAKFAYL